MIRLAARVLLAGFYAVAGVMHIVRPEPFLAIMPGWVPAPEAVVLWTGFAEIAGAVGLLQPFSLRLRQAAGIGLALYALCVWPANIHHFALDMARADGGLGLAYHVPRMVAQPILIWLALWVGEVIGCAPGAKVSEARATIRALLAERGDDATICPSEAARALAAPEGDWRARMADVHHAVDAMLASGAIEISWKGKQKEQRRGPYRIARRLLPSQSDEGGEP